ncbi:NAD(P)/FAD-dependent oxidoreductase [Pantoea sp. 18069]|uniref:NAD(P)/FAD-dependent oxidoreductase n=1 Tax=Pantoea sp. 18069 TaxID=2681415 RepID=UPI0013567632|nr:FAD-dependent oxidoreductase [Pantoea sp. 18069]
MTATRTLRTPAPVPTAAQHPRRARHRPQVIAVIGAGIAGLACARTLVQAGHQVKVFEQGSQVGGRMAVHSTSHGSFDSGAQYFTVRDPRFEQVLALSPKLCRPWSATTIRVLDSAGRIATAVPPPRESHWVATPHMQSLPAAWAQPLADAGQLLTQCRVTALERDRLDPTRWQLQTENALDATEQTVHAGFDTVLLALPAPLARALLEPTGLADLHCQALGEIDIAPCWTLHLTFAQAQQPGLTTLGPHWNAARSTHHRVAWLARESSKPGRSSMERWTVQASPAWSQEHRNDDGPRIQAKLQKAFAEITGIHATPSHVSSRFWPHAQTMSTLGHPFLWNRKTSLGVCGDWCLGARVEDAFVSGLELALKVA